VIQLILEIPKDDYIVKIDLNEQLKQNENVELNIKYPLELLIKDHEYKIDVMKNIYEIKHDDYEQKDHD
jgi:hypothetical protein